MQQALESLPWVRKATVDFKKKQATLTVEEDRYNPKAVFAALKKAGFFGKPLEQQTPPSKCWRRDSLTYYETNPSGGCCLGNVSKAIKHALALKEKGLL